MPYYTAVKDHGEKVCWMTFRRLMADASLGTVIGTDDEPAYVTDAHPLLGIRALLQHSHATADDAVFYEVDLDPATLEPYGRHFFRAPRATLVRRLSPDDPLFSGEELDALMADAHAREEIGEHVVEYYDTERDAERVRRIVKEEMETDFSMLMSVAVCQLSQLKCHDLLVYLARDELPECLWVWDARISAVYRMHYTLGREVLRELARSGPQDWQCAEDVRRIAIQRLDDALDADVIDECVRSDDVAVQAAALCVIGLERGRKRIHRFLNAHAFRTYKDFGDTFALIQKLVSRLDPRADRVMLARLAQCVHVDSIIRSAAIERLDPYYNRELLKDLSRSRRTSWDASRRLSRNT